MNSHIKKYFGVLPALVVALSSQNALATAYDDDSAADAPQQTVAVVGSASAAAEAAAGGAGATTDSAQEDRVVNFLVKQLSGLTHLVKISENATVLDVKRYLFYRYKIPVDAQQLLYQGKTRDDSTVLKPLQLEKLAFGFQLIIRQAAAVDVEKQGAASASAAAAAAAAPTVADVEADEVIDGVAAIQTEMRQLDEAYRSLLSQFDRSHPAFKTILARINTLSHEQQDLIRRRR